MDDDTPGLDPGIAGILNHASKLYTRQMVAQEGLDWATGSGDLDEESKRLDNAMKRRALGYPDTSDEYEDSTNNNSHLFLRTLGSGLQQVPEPGFMKPNASESWLSNGLEAFTGQSRGGRNSFLSSGLSAFGGADKVKPKSTESALKGIKDVLRALRIRRP